ncbi:MAG: esterase [Bacteroidetes bacterium]|jgi:enterochelin esterase family protein|nr:esterase [Bacteroidota bacterium]
MVLKFNSRYLFVWLLCCFPVLATAQPPRGPLAISPQINADKTVTFRYLAPSAKSVRLSTQFERAPLEMTKNEYGMWSATVSPVTPDIYPYNFIVDGMQVMDPGNVDFFPNERFKASLVDIPDDPSLIHSLRDVPHGTVTYEYYPSAEETTGSLVVYTPPGYETDLSKSYPVFYLIGGTTDTEETWFKVGRANFILDNLISEGKAQPMIIVMPYGNVEGTIAAQKGLPKPADPADREGEEAVHRAKTFENDLTDNIIPYIEKNYRVISNGDNRAIGGFSRGGGQTLRAGFANMDKFSWICCFSAYLTDQEMESSYRHVYENPELTNKQLKLLWISVGNEDFLYEQTVDFMDFLKSKNVRYKNLISSGGHTWMNTRLFLTETAQLLFK